jgi:hypothetical protein
MNTEVQKYLFFLLFIQKIFASCIVTVPTYGPINYVLMTGPTLNLPEFGISPPSCTFTYDSDV